MCAPDRLFQRYGSETGGQKTQGSEPPYKGIPKFTREDMLPDMDKRMGLPPGVVIRDQPGEPDVLDAGG